MALRWLLVLSVLAFGNCGVVKSIDGASVKLEIEVNTDQGSKHDSVALIKEDEKWKALKDKNREGISLVSEVRDDKTAGIELNVNVNGEPVNVTEITPETEAETNEISEEKVIKDTEESPQVDGAKGRIFSPFVLRKTLAKFFQDRKNFAKNYWMMGRKRPRTTWYG